MRGLLREHGWRSDVSAGVSHSFEREVVGESASTREDSDFSLVRVLQTLQRGHRAWSSAAGTEAAVGKKAASEINIDL